MGKDSKKGQCRCLSGGASMTVGLSFLDRVLPLGGTRDVTELKPRPFRLGFHFSVWKLNSRLFWYYYCFFFSSSCYCFLYFLKIVELKKPPPPGSVSIFHCGSWIFAPLLLLLMLFLLLSSCYCFLVFLWRF